MRSCQFVFPNTVRVISQKGLEHAAWIREKINASMDLVQKLEGKRPFIRPRRRWDYIKMRFKETQGERMD